MKAFVDLHPSPRTTSILLGHIVGTFKTSDVEGDVIASGKTLRVSVKGYSGFVDIDVRNAVDRAVKYILANHETRP